MNATPANDWVQQLLALQYASALYASLAQAASSAPPGADANAVALAQQTAVANWFTNGAAATSVPASDTPAGAYYANGASATSVRTDQDGGAWYTNGANVTSVPSGDAGGASYFTNGTQATNVPPAPSASASANPPAGATTVPGANEANDAGALPSEALSDEASAPLVPEPIDTATANTSATVATGQEAFALNESQPAQDASSPNMTIANSSAAGPTSQSGGGRAGGEGPGNAAAPPAATTTIPGSQRIAVYETRPAPSSADAVRSPMMGVRVGIALFGGAVMAWLVIGKILARRARPRDPA